MNGQRLLDAATALDLLVHALAGAIATGCAIWLTPLVFWAPAWTVLALAFGYALVRREGSHWPSTIFGTLEASYILALVVLLARDGLSPMALTYLFFGLLFVHGILYLLAAKPFLTRRGYLKPPAA